MSTITDTNTPIAKASYQAGETLPAVGSPEYAQAQQMATATPIAVDNLGKAPTPIKIPSSTTVPTISPAVPVPKGTTVDSNGTATVNPPTNTEVPQKSTYEKLLDKMGVLGDALSKKADTTVQLQNDMDLAGKTVQATNDYNAYVKKKTEVQQQLEEMRRTNPEGKFGGARTAEIAEFERRSNADLANLAIQAQASQGLLSATQQTIKDKIEAQFSPIQEQVDFLTKFTAINNNDLTESEKLKLTEIANQKKTDLASLTKTSDELHQLMLQNKAPQSVYSALDKVVNDYVAGRLTVTDAQSKMYQAVGSYGVDTYKSLQIQKMQQEINENKPVTGEYAPIINSVSSLVGATKAPAVKKAISTAIANKDFSTAYANIANAVEDSLTGTNKTKFADARTDIGVMTGMRDAIKAYTDAGGNIGYLKGTADSIAKRFGQLATDPKFASLGVQLQREFQSYRNNMTGAAFSPAESAEYAKVNPRVDASLDLNLATIDGAISQLNNRVNSTINQRIPEAKSIYDKAFGNTNEVKTVKSNGNDYVVGKLYEDASKKKWTVDSNGKWTEVK